LIARRIALTAAILARVLRALRIRDCLVFIVCP
jgi:hypothetical protein